ncbi:MAG TPA: hypothetical protein VEA69_10300 [Tepidisphaeraceae bacterium]|nr:hypothetical protein [Tepidisphaeraceae bacterium]
MLEGLDEVDWLSLRHAYGPADDVPDQIRALAGPNRPSREDALYGLFGNIWHQGTVYEASEYAVPFLLELAGDPAVSGRDGILSLLHALATGHSYLDVHATPDSHVFAAERAEPDFVQRLERELSHVRAAHDAVARGANLLLDLTRDRDPMISGGAAHVLSALPDDKSRIAARILEMAQSASDPILRGGCLLCLGTLRPVGSETSTYLEQVVRVPAPREIVYAAAWALAQAAGPATVDEAIPPLASAVADPTFAEDCLHGLPWDWSAEVRPGEALIRIGPRAVSVAVPTLINALGRADRVDASFISDALLGLIFPGGRVYTRPDALVPEQLRVIRAIAEADVVWEHPSLFVCGFQQLGLVGPGAHTESGWRQARAELRGVLDGSP